MSLLKGMNYGRTQMSGRPPESGFSPTYLNFPLTWRDCLSKVKAEITLTQPLVDFDVERVFSSQLPISELVQPNRVPTFCLTGLFTQDHRIHTHVCSDGDDDG